MLIKKAHRHRGRKKAQSVVEYAIFIAAISAALIGLQIYFQRGVKGNYKQRADSVGGQFTTTQDYSIESQSQTLRSADSGYLNEDGSEYWSKSKILGSDGESGIAKTSWTGDLKVIGKKLNYTGHEFSKTDYVSATVGGGGVGAHGNFDSGVLGTIKPWDDN